MDIAIYLLVAGLSPVLCMALGTARSTLSGRISWTFLGTIESSPSFNACVLPVDWLAAPPVGWTYHTIPVSISVEQNILHTFLER